MLSLKQKKKLRQEMKCEHCGQKDGLIFCNGGCGKLIFHKKFTKDVGHRCPACADKKAHEVQP